MSKKARQRAARVSKSDDVPLEQRKFATAILARTALMERGYNLAATPPGTPAMWSQMSDLTVRRAVRGRGDAWRVVPYPVATLRAAEGRVAARLKELAKEAAKAERPAKGRGRAAARAEVALEPGTRLEPGPRKPGYSHRKATKAACGDGSTVAELCKRAKCDVAELTIMVQKRFLVLAR